MLSIKKILNNPYSIKKIKKIKLILNYQIMLNKYHSKKCYEYNNIIKNKIIKKITELPYLSIKLFKNMNLKSIKNNKIYKTLTSSGTTGEPSKIFLDKNAAKIQQIALSKTVTQHIGSERLPMIIVDSDEIFKNRIKFSARIAAILGFSIFANDKVFMLDQKKLIKTKEINQFLKKHSNKDILVFGFTFNIWKYLAIKKKINIKNSLIIIHGGGWKKMKAISVGNNEFKKKLINKYKIKKIINYYGLIEQIGSIFMECEEGYFHCSNYNDIIIRDMNLNEIKNNKIGIIQLLSLLPKSYPGHNLLTEDMGSIIGEDDCKCGRYGKYFKVYGRIPQSEIRGCSDTQNTKEH